MLDLYEDSRAATLGQFENHLHHSENVCRERRVLYRGDASFKCFRVAKLEPILRGTRLCRFRPRYPAASFVQM